jgi:hypothetical protein
MIVLPKKATCTERISNPGESAGFFKDMFLYFLWKTI